uniref:Ribosomal RNA-processing protein 43 n=1 Tax=Chlamydomonas leiostraca TaxID=1034604 RepID=A0A7S0WPP7_9CHLO|mmetsp:Transcript_2220/g.5642  ORF Transcript_2220/g.5642 Transcript_2220/m.5642 type:complete len:298 (+) Transcript_2220:2-895(+)
MATVLADEGLQADAFKKLYPNAYFQRWVEEGVRPDGRTLGRGRPLTIGVGAVASCRGSAMVKLGHTTVLAGIQVSLGRPSDELPDQGSLVVNVEYAPFATADYRPGKPSEQACAVSERLQALLRPMGLEQQLCIKSGKAAFTAEANIYVLNADGCVLDAVLLATTTALRDLKLPAVKDTKEGGVRMDDSAAARKQPARHLTLPCQPLAISMALYKDKLLVDPTVEEESIASSSVTVVLDERSRLHGMYKTGGSVLATPMVLTQCIEAAKLRYREMSALVQQQLEEAAAEEAGEDMES